MSRQVHITPNGYAIHCDGWEHISYKGRQEVARWKCCCGKVSKITPSIYQDAGQDYGKKPEGVHWPYNAGNWTGD